MAAHHSDRLAANRLTTRQQKGVNYTVPGNFVALLKAQAWQGIEGWIILA
jgi:hypothetical protein